MSNGQNPFQVDLPGMPGVPMPGTGSDPMGGNIDVGELLKKILSSSAARASRLPGPGPGVAGALGQAQQRAPMAGGPFRTKEEGIQGFIQNVGAAVQNAVKQHKEKQIMGAMNDFSVLQKAWEDAQQMAQQG